MARTCGPCIDLQYSNLNVDGQPRIVAARDYRQCLTTLCMPESLAVPLEPMESGHHTLLVELYLYDLEHDSTTCTISRIDTVGFDVPAVCKPPLPVPYTDVIRIGPPPSCDTCPPPPICPRSDIPFLIAGDLPNGCFQFRGLELLPSMIVGPMPEPPVVRVTIAHQDCSPTPCAATPVPWQAEAMLPGLPPRDYELFVQMEVTGWCDSTRTADTLITGLVPFVVADTCGANAWQTTGVSTTSSPFRLSPAWPNPFSRETRFVVSLLVAAEIDLGVFDLAGRRVATLYRGPLETGDHPFVWDGARSDGTRAAGGVYFYRVSGAATSVTRRMIVLGAR